MKRFLHKALRNGSIPVILFLLLIISTLLLSNNTRAVIRLDTFFGLPGQAIHPADRTGSQTGGAPFELLHAPVPASTYRSGFSTSAAKSLDEPPIKRHHVPGNAYRINGPATLTPIDLVITPSAFK